MSYSQPLTPEEKLADAKKLLSLPRIVVICGSTRFMTEMNEADLRETKAGRVVVKPGCDMKSPHELWSDPVEAEALKVRLDDLHRAKIRLARRLILGDASVASGTAVHRRAGHVARHRARRRADRSRLHRLRFGAGRGQRRGPRLVTGLA
ncbi:hypothetical protein ABZ776_35285 [Streptomyces sp. NPDC007076]|uniref:hypothetical protein n=1 Tax=unclassified Streptomyces TaxID=2593676 RepID=UPI0033EE0E26